MQALLSTANRQNLIALAQALHELGIHLIASGGTARFIKEAGLSVIEVSALTGVPEFLGGRVKTLHPAIYGGILACDTVADQDELASKGYVNIDFVICNLYPFQDTIAKEGLSIAEAIENIDIGGVTLLRAAAKNYERVTVICDLADYDQVVRELKEQGQTRLKTRQALALKAFQHTAQYDDAIANYYRQQFAPEQGRYRYQGQQALRYGTNPHQQPAQVYQAQGALSDAACPRHRHNQVYQAQGALPLTTLNGSPGYINLLDALNSWQLVKELKAALNLPAAASFKHVSPAGAAVAIPLNKSETQAYFVSNMDLSPLATAYARARGADRISSFGDWIALSDTVDLATAKLIKREISDGIIAPAYEAKALAILKRKKGGRYPILQIDSAYEPPLLERRDVFGLTLEQGHNNCLINADLMTNIVSTSQDLPESAIRDLIVATIALKYTQSNSVAYAYRGQIVGLGAGQQSRIHCTHLAGDKVNNWWLRQHPRLLSLPFRRKLSRPDKSNAIDLYIIDDMTAVEHEAWVQNFDPIPEPLTSTERSEWLAKLTDVAFSSDAFIPFRDNIDRASRSGVKYVAEPGGARRDDAIIEAANEYGMTLIFHGTRLFHH